MADENAVTETDLTQLARFFERRCWEELEATGGMSFFLEKEGFTLTYQTPPNTLVSKDHAKDFVGGWLDRHPPARFCAMAVEMALLADELARQASSNADWQVRQAWKVLARSACRLWPDHCDLLPAWTETQSPMG
ncbi:hypothetical protein [Streptomyces agglomeratus]|nr:hypothetical protein [Streptomyces agglomeratus]